MCTFAMQTAPQKPGHGQSGWAGRHFFGKRLSALILDEQKLSPPFAGRQQIQTSTLFCIQTSGQDVTRPTKKSGIMALLIPLKNEKSAHAETSAMRHPASRPAPPFLTPILLKRAIIRPALLLILLLSSTFSAFAYDCTVDGVYYNLNTTDKTASVIKGSYSGDIVIPETITNNDITYSVTSIGEYAFMDCIGLTSITIPNSVADIGRVAFFGCTGLTSVSIPNSVTSIGDSAFEGCSGLTSVTIPNSVTSIGDDAFRGCSSLISVVIPNSVTSIGDYAFYDCTGLHSLTIGTGVLSIGQYAIGYYYNYGYGKRKKTVEKVIWLPNTPPTGYSEVNSRVSYVANDLYTGMSCEYKYIYKYLSSLFEVDGIRYVPVSPSERTCDAIDCTYNQEQTDISLCKTVSYKGVSMTLKDIKPYTCYNNTHITKVIVNYDGNIGDYAFHDCPLKTVYIGGNISYSTSSDKGYSPFYRNTSLEKVIITDKETEITANEFYGCTGLKYITMGDGIEKIGDWAFSGCSSLDFFRVGSNVKTIGKEAFSDCTAMTKLITTAPVPPTCGSQALDDINKWTCELFVNKESIDQYKAAEQWKEFFFISEYDGVDDVSVDTPDALYEVYNLQGVRVGSGMHEAEVTADALPHGVYILVSPQGRKKLKI